MPVEFTPDARFELDNFSSQEQLAIARALEAELRAVHRALQAALGSGSATGSGSGIAVLRARGCVVLVVVSVQPPEAGEP
ncbi:MAG TPA: hypothetical protein VIK45_12290 [Candidatus Dormibacteraeota bacterium]